jgi:hypothetical protein
MISNRQEMILDILSALFLTTILFFYSFPAHAAETNAAAEAPSSSSSSPSDSPELMKDEDLLIMPTGNKIDPMGSYRSYIVQSGGSLPIYDSDFKDFIDYGATIALGMKKKIMPHVYVTPTLGLTLLTGNWDMSKSRQDIIIEAQSYNTSYGDISPEDVNPVNTGDGYMSGGEAVVTNPEFLQSIDLETSMYMIPLTLNLTYQLHDDGVRKVNPYIGGGIGFCVAKREVESKTLKENSYDGPNYFLDFNDNQTVTGQVLQFFAGIEIPFQKNMKIVADSTTTLYSLKNFDPILSIAYKKPNPAYYVGSDLQTWTLEDPINIGVFDEEFVTSFSLGLVVPF